MTDFCKSVGVKSGSITQGCGSKEVGIGKAVTVFAHFLV